MFSTSGILILMLFCFNFYFYLSSTQLVCDLTTSDQYPPLQTEAKVLDEVALSDEDVAHVIRVTYLVNTWTKLEKKKNTYYNITDMTNFIIIKMINYN
jgi:hypothetical protein